MLKISSNSQVQNTFESLKVCSCLFGLFIRLGLVAASDEDLVHHQLPPGLPLSSAYLHTACPPVRVFEDSPQQSVAITVNCYTVTVPQQSVAVTVDAKVSSLGSSCWCEGGNDWRWQSCPPTAPQVEACKPCGCAGVTSTEPALSWGDQLYGQAVSLGCPSQPPIGH